MFIVYDGPSEIDGGPVFAAITGVGRPSSNRKTGPLMQLYLLRSDLHPMDAVRSGDDRSICGGCPHRPINKRADKPQLGQCYAAGGPDMMAAGGIYRAYKAKQYKFIDAYAFGNRYRSRSIRLGAYGDPACLPSRVLFDLLLAGIGHTGYTHQWRARPELREILMASVDSAQEAEKAARLGWSTFRVRVEHDRGTLLTSEVQCPAALEGGHTTQCISCMKCSGLTKMLETIHVACDGHGNLRV